MAAGRKPHGRPTHLNDRVTRSAAVALATQLPGAGVWRRSHDGKMLYPLFCAALLQERLARRTIRRPDGSRPSPRLVYPCEYGDHYLISTAARHWHIGRPAC
jgi:hypothetical protein